ncbi:MAG: hypothetical protein WCK67_07860 [bacterium]
MNLLHIFNLKKDFKYLKDSGKLDQFKLYVENTVIMYVNKELSGDDKKQAVIALVTGHISRVVTPINPIIATILLAITPNIVQYLYDSLKKYVGGLTVNQA